MLTTPVLALIGALSLKAAGAPTQTEKRAAPLGIPGLLSNISSISGSNYGEIESALENIVPMPSPTSAEEAASRLQSAYAEATPTSYFQAAAVIIKSGLASNNLESIAAGFNNMEESNAFNNNPRNPSKSIYPKKAPGDAPYQQAERKLRKHIYIPSTFTYGKKPPVILVPGTGERGGGNFIVRCAHRDPTTSEANTSQQGNLIPLMTGRPWADIVWVNPEGFQLNDAQTSAENIAYAINYISGISQNKPVSLIGWSQGSESMQWAVKYWPSARKLVTDIVAISADYHGTKMANRIDPLGTVPLPPAVKQQEYDSPFIAALRSDGGDSAYVPTTTIYSGFFDEIVEPQQGAGASAFLKDARNIGVSNYQVQATCPKGSPAAGFYTHESMLVNPLTFALIEDALTHAGPGKASRLNLASVCSTAITPGLTLTDFLATEATIPFAGFQILRYPGKVVAQPAVKSYA